MALRRGNPPPIAVALSHLQALRTPGGERVRGRVGASAAVPRRAEAATRRAQLPSGSLAGQGRSTDFAPGSEEARQGSDFGERMRERSGWVVERGA